jgi:hypothetical protein
MAARLLDSNGHIAHIISNYSHLSFNVGPTLHRWIARHDPLLALGIMEADRRAGDALGAGGAIAQAYNHMILPLSADRDIKTQVKWGAADFEHRFRRKPSGMWLPETAADTRSLEALAAEGIGFTILAPHQCAAVRPPGGSWTETPGGEGLDVTRPYLMTLPSGRAITLVFYHGGIAHDIAFGGLLDSGDFFAESLIRELPRDDEPRLLMVATDGESYGHHHHFGEMALGRAAQLLCESSDLIMANAAAFLKRYPARWQCRIAENTSWSCAHGIERWRSSCGCHTGGEPWWDQSWRAPLRDALDRLRDNIDEIYDKEMKRFCDDPWALRDEAAALYLADGAAETETAEELKEVKRAFLRGRCGDLNPDDTVKVLSMIEAQRMRMFMYTSCGWFFNDVSGIETRQILAYAIRAAEHIRNVSGRDLEGKFLDDLREVRGNSTELPTAFEVVRQTVFPNRRTIRDIAAAASLLKADRLFYSFRIDRKVKRYQSANMDMDVSRMMVTDTRTLEEWVGNSMVITTGGLDDVCRLSEKALPDPSEVWRHFFVGDIFSISKFIEKEFEFGPWHFADLTADDRDIIVRERTKNAEKEHMEYAHNLLEDNQRLLVQLNLLHAGSESFLVTAGEFVYSRLADDLCAGSGSILEMLEHGSRLEELLSEAHNVGIYPKISVLAPKMEQAFYDNLIEADRKNDEKALRKLLEQWRRAVELAIGIDGWRLQNVVWGMLEEKTEAPSGTLLEFADELGFATPGK